MLALLRQIPGFGVKTQAWNLLWNGPLDNTNLSSFFYVYTQSMEMEDFNILQGNS